MTLASSGAPQSLETGSGQSFMWLRSSAFMLAPLGAGFKAKPSFIPSPKFHINYPNSGSLVHVKDDYGSNIPT